MVTFLLYVDMAFLHFECTKREFSDVPLVRTQILPDQGPTLMTSFNLNYLLIGPISKI